jgi:hypothetical protein
VALILKETVEEAGRIFLKNVPVEAELINEYTKQNLGERKKKERKEGRKEGRNKKGK